MHFSSYDMLALKDNLPALVPLLTGVVIVIIISKVEAILKSLTALLSRAINIILLRCYQIKHIEHGDLPTLPYVFPNGQGNVEKFLRGRENSVKWGSEYGSLYRIWSGLKGEIVLTKPAHVEAVFQDSHNHIKAHANDSGFLMHRLLGLCLGLISRKSWSAVRSCVEVPFSHKSMSSYVTEIQDFTREYMRRLEQDNHVFGDDGMLHPVHDLKLLPFLFIAKVVYGPLSPEIERELIDLVLPRENLFKYVISGGITRFSFSRFLFLPAIRALHDFKTRWAQWNDRAHAHAIERPGGSAAPVIAMYRAVDDGRMTREQLLQTLDEILFANIDITVGGMSWVLVFLAAHPVVQKNLRHEIYEQSGKKNTYLHSPWTTSRTLLGACILEAARLRPIAAFSVPQSCPSPRILDGFEIPAGTNFVIDSYALNIRDAFWGSDREKFRPERWLERPRTGRDLRYRYWRFGFGPRTCLGKHLAELIIRSVIVEVLENWHITLLDTAREGEKVVDENDGRAGRTGDEAANWPWDDELWIHSPKLVLKFESLPRCSV